jgi:signal transduction histidine kinase
VAVSLSLSGKNLLVSIQDDGQGFDPQNIPSGHYGILGIRERVRLVNGDVEIQNEAGKGTTVKVSIPHD